MYDGVSHETRHAFLFYALDEQTSIPVELYGSVKEVLQTYGLLASCAEKGQIEFTFLSVKNTEGEFLRDFTNFPPKHSSDEPHSNDER